MAWVYERSVKRREIHESYCVGQICSSLHNLKRRSQSDHVFVPADFMPDLPQPQDNHSSSEASMGDERDMKVLRQIERMGS